MTILLITHIVLMISSISLTAGMAVTSGLSKAVPKQIVRSNLVVTSTGILSGLILLSAHPLGTKCAALFAYTLAFAATYMFVTKRNRVLRSVES